MELWDDFSFTFSTDDVLHGEGADPGLIRTKRPGLVKTASVALLEGSTTLKPISLLQKVKVIDHRHERIILEGGQELTSPSVAHHLAGAEKVALVICTIGSQLENLASASMDDNPLLGLALDGLGNAAVGMVAQQVCERIGHQAQTCGLTTSTPISPGELDWSVEIGQPQIFAMLDPSRAGIALTSGGMMIPKKSISFVVGIGPEMTQSDPCELCSLRERCHYRHA